ncbi:MAG: DUF2314 domain-containing protein [Pseudomonadota bacterium]
MFGEFCARIWTVLRVVVTLAALAFAMSLPIIARAGDPVIKFATDDPVMSSAIGQARASLPAFLDRVADPEAEIEYPVLKIAYTTLTGDGEHVWVDRLSIGLDGTLSGHIANDPVNLPQIRLYDRVEIDLSRVSDWGYTQDGLLHGYYTLRAMLPHLPAADAAVYRAVLAPLPSS